MEHRKQKIFTKNNMDRHRKKYSKPKKNRVPKRKNSRHTRKPTLTQNPMEDIALAYIR